MSAPTNNAKSNKASSSAPIAKGKSIKSSTVVSSTMTKKFSINVGRSKNFEIKTVSKSNFETYVDSSEESVTDHKKLKIKARGISQVDKERLRKVHAETIKKIEESKRKKREIKDKHKVKFMNPKICKDILTKKYTTKDSLEKDYSAFYAVIHSHEAYVSSTANFKSRPMKSIRKKMLDKTRGCLNAPMPSSLSGKNGFTILCPTKPPGFKLSVPTISTTSSDVCVVTQPTNVNKFGENNLRVLRRQQKRSLTGVITKTKNQATLKNKLKGASTTAMDKNSRNKGVVSLVNPKKVVKRTVKNHAKPKTMPPVSNLVSTPSGNNNRKINIACINKKPGMTCAVLSKMRLLATIGFERMPSNPEKIAEASFSDIFLVDAKDNKLGFEAPEHLIVAKIIPLNSFYTEIAFKKECYALEQLKDVPCIVKCHFSCLLRGSYSPEYVDAFAKYSKKTENTCPSTYKPTQKYGCIFMEYAGIDLESFHFLSTAEILHFLDQLLKIIKNLQDQFKFEHRDMHWGNILIKRTGKPGDIIVTLIDLSLCRFDTETGVVHSDLYHKNSSWIFRGDSKADYQYEVYRMMMRNVERWDDYSEQNNLLWIGYILRKLMVKAQNLESQTLLGFLGTCIQMTAKANKIDDLIKIVEEYKKKE